MKRLMKLSWEWPLCVVTLLVLGLMLLGHGLFGLSGWLNTLFVSVGTLVMALFVAPLVALGVGMFASLSAAVAAVLGTLILPLAALVNGLLIALWSWLLTTWVGTLLVAPVYGALAPVVLKVLPFISLGKYLHTAYDWLDDQPWWPQKLVLTENKRLKKASRKGYAKGRGRATPAAAKRSQRK